jgi:hypothetical protein
MRILSYKLIAEYGIGNELKKSKLRINQKEFVEWQK